MPLYLPGFLLNLGLTALLCAGLAWLYRTYGTSLSSRDSLSRTFILLGVTTALIISIVKSSLALSLGLVGALSIVRFRAAIKEPEELVYLFLCIAIGLGMGAEQRWASILALALLTPIIIFRNLQTRKREPLDLLLSLRFTGDYKPNLDDLLAVMDPHCNSIQLKRLDESEEQLEISFVIGLDQTAALSSLKSQLRSQYPTHHFSLLDQKTLTSI